jgi:hypothetical protein
MKVTGFICQLLACFLLAACSSQSTCPDGSITYLEDPSLFPPDTSAGQSFSKVEMEIRNKILTFDRVVSGPVCNDTWEDTVYITCEVQLLQWEGKPDFLSNGCNLEVKPDAIIYVAAHNNATYYKGCNSCH